MAPTGGNGGDGGDDDDAAFAEAMRGARPLPPGHRACRSGRRPRRRGAAWRRRSPLPLLRSSSNRPATRISGRAPDVATKQVRELRTGAHAVDARLDLHGRAGAEALRGWKSSSSRRGRAARAGCW